MDSLFHEGRPAVSLRPLPIAVPQGRVTENGRPLSL